MEIDNHCNNTCYAVELTLLEEERRARHMKKFKDAMLQISMSKNPHRSPDQLVMLEKYIDERLPSVMPSLLCAPDHPPYADMIIIAIRTLGEKRGSKKSSISNFINETYKNLPLQHDLILTRDLQRLVQVGQIVCIYKSRYKFPADSKPNANNQQQDSEKQIVLREVGGLMTKKHSAVVEVADPVDVDLHGLPMVLSEKHPTSLVEVFDPIDVDSAGGRLVDLTEQPLAMIELETVGGGSNPLEAVTGAMKPSEEKLPRHGRNLRKRKSKVEQHKEIVEKSTEIVPSLGTLVNDDVVGHGSKESLPKNHTMAMIEFETIYGDGSGSKPLEAVIVAVKPSEEKLPRYGRNLRKRKSEVEQHEEIIEKSTEIVPSLGTLVNDDDDDDDVVGHGSKESLKESLLCVTEVFDLVEVDGTGDRLITLPKKHTSAMIELETMGGGDVLGGGLKPLEAVIEAVEPSQEKLPQRGRNLRKRKSDVEQQEDETKMKLPISDPQSLPHKKRPGRSPSKKRLGGPPPMRKCEGKQEPRRGPARAAKIKSKVEQQQETLPSTAAAGNDDPVVGIEFEISESQEQQRRHQSRLPMKERKGQQKQEVLMQDEQWSLVSSMKEPSITDVAVRDTTQEQQQREVRQLRPRLS